MKQEERSKRKYMTCQEALDTMNMIEGDLEEGGGCDL